MSSKEISWLEKKERTYLKEILPLDVPLSINIEATNMCNFKCRYCLHSISEVKRKFRDILPLETFEKLTNELSKTHTTINTITFTGAGEPLLHKYLSTMIQLSKKVAEKVSIITNGVLLTPEKSMELINSGVDYIRISLQGIDSQEYYKNSGVNIDFETFIANIKYLFDHKQQCEIHLKFPVIAGEAINKSKIYSIFNNLCDAISFQNIVHLFDKVEFTKSKAVHDKTIFNEEMTTKVIVCPQPFYTLQILANGGIAPCCHLEASNSLLLGDIEHNNILDIWHGEKMRNIRNAHLINKKKKYPICQGCKYLKYTINKYDNIDSIRKKLFSKINKEYCHNGC